MIEEFEVENPEEFEMMIQNGDLRIRKALVRGKFMMLQLIKTISNIL